MTTRDTVAGGPGDFMMVHHLTVRGSQAEIGRTLAREARTRYGWTPDRVLDRNISIARRAWFERYWPQHCQRMNGVADELGIVLEHNQYDVDGLSGFPTGSGCSVTWSPPGSTARGHGLVGRNYDYVTTGQQQLFALLAGREAPQNEQPVASRPLVITTVPDDGPATTAIAMRQLDGCLEGVNEHGLVVTLLLADAESAGQPVNAGPQVGISGGQLPRYVLDTCADIEQAKRALLAAKHYDHGLALHYLIADAAGRAFVWERSHGGIEHIVDADDNPMCVTNHLLHRHPDPTNLPQDTEDSMLTYRRLRTLADRIGGAMSAARLRSVLDDVGFDAGNSGKHPIRTLWRSVFDLSERTMSTRFYLGDGDGGIPRYSTEKVFSAAS